MKKILTLVFLTIGMNTFAQGIELEDLVTKETRPMIMPDGIRLMTDFYLPIASKDIRIPIQVPVPLLGNIEVQINLIPQGQQYIIYDSLNGQPNPNPFKLPTIFSRTPYNKGSFDFASVIFGLFGYGYAIQDMRGRYTSQGVYLPIYSDGWDKNPYHPNYGHVLDVTDLSDPRNGNRHEDGYNSVQFLINNVKRLYDLDGDGIFETQDDWSNGWIGTFGASALGYNQYQAAAARKINPNQPGLKCLLPIVATQEFFKSTGYQNGVFREQLVTGWLKGQIFTGTNDQYWDIDDDIDNNIHTSRDYGLPNKFQAANRAIDHFAQIRYIRKDGSLSPAGYYPNSVGRVDMDASIAKVDANGMGDINGQYSRYSNMEVPAYHLTGWWDIFTDGQIETWARMRKDLNPALGNNRKQKIVIGPWAHQTIGSRTTGDITYPENVTDILGIDVGGLSESNIPVGRVIESELVSWYRYNLNYNPQHYLGEPKARLPRAKEWSNVNIGGFGALQIKAPSEDYIFPLNDLISFINGTGGLPGFPIQIQTALTGQTDIVIDIPALGSPLIDGLDGQPIPPIKYVDFENDIPNFRFYVPGPVNDGIPENATVGNYWFSTDSFPMPHLTTRTKFYLRGNATITKTPPTSDEGSKLFIHDPNDPVRTVGGANMIVKTPDGLRDSQGQFNLKNPAYAPFTMDRPEVLQFETEILQDTMSMAGFPVVRLYASTHPAGALSGPTDTDFHIRIVDVYPDGREMFVVEGCVNARGRLYAKSLVTEDDELAPYDDEDINAPFENINIGQIYEYHFHTMPIAYTFGKQHRMKILISSSNWPRYQSNPNIPINPGEFFRRKPGDGQTYVFNGVEMSPRIAVQRVYFSPQHPSYIALPILDPAKLGVKEDNITIEAQAKDILVFPNPATDMINVYTPRVSDYIINLYDMTGKIVERRNITSDYAAMDLTKLNNGLYILEVIDRKSGFRSQSKITKH